MNQPFFFFNPHWLIFFRSTVDPTRAPYHTTIIMKPFLFALLTAAISILLAQTGPVEGGGFNIARFFQSGTAFKGALKSGSSGVTIKQVSRNLPGKSTSWTSRNANSIADAIKDEIKDNAPEFVLNYLTDQLGLSPPQSSASDSSVRLQSYLNFAKARNITVSAIKTGITSSTSSSTSPRLRIVSTSSKMCDMSAASIASIGTGLSLTELDDFASGGDITVGYKSCNTLSRTQCSIVMGMEETSVDVAHRWEFGYAVGSASGTCISQKHDFLTDCLLQDNSSPCPSSSTVHSACSSGTVSTCGVNFHRSSYQSRGCSEIPVSSLCAFIDSSGESSFLQTFSNTAKSKGFSSVCVIDIPISSSEVCISTQFVDTSSMLADIDTLYNSAASFAPPSSLIGLLGVAIAVVLVSVFL